jgi:hypothetical protein
MMKMKKVNHIVFNLCLLAGAVVLFSGCSKKDDPAPAAKINLKITLTVVGADNMDQVDFGVSAGNHDASQYGSPVWKKDGVTQGNEGVILISQSAFFGATKTYVFETVKPFDFGSLSVSYTNREGTPISLSYKTEVNGVAQTNESLTVPVGTDVQTKNYSYRGN